VSNETRRQGRRPRELRQRFIVVLPDAMAARIRAMAEEGHRPLNSQFELLLERALDTEPAVAA
jgi:hypothetical protein